MDNPEGISSRNSYSRTNDCTDLSNPRFSKKTEVLKLHKILRKTSSASSLPNKNWPKSPTRVQEWDPPSFEFPTCANTCSSLNLIELIIIAGHAWQLNYLSGHTLHLHYVDLLAIAAHGNNHC
jgi:hypothetical protein